jgi:hypothetical protein
MLLKGSEQDEKNINNDHLIFYVLPEKIIYDETNDENI